MIQNLFQREQKYESRDNVSVTVAVRVHLLYLLEVWLSMLKGNLEPAQPHYLDMDFQIQFHEEAAICAATYAEE